MQLAVQYNHLTLNRPPAILSPPSPSLSSLRNSAGRGSGRGFILLLECKVQLFALKRERKSLLGVWFQLLPCSSKIQLQPATYRLRVKMQHIILETGKLPLCLLFKRDERAQDPSPYSQQMLSFYEFSGLIFLKKMIQYLRYCLYLHDVLHHDLAFHVCDSNKTFK